jgi:hypothetical protein
MPAPRALDDSDHLRSRMDVDVLAEGAIAKKAPAWTPVGPCGSAHAHHEVDSNETVSPRSTLRSARQNHRDALSGARNGPRWPLQAPRRQEHGPSTEAGKSQSAQAARERMLWYWDERRAERPVK